MSAFESGEKRRQYSKTKFNHNSSRSHVILKIIIEIKSKKNMHKMITSSITLADLAGSEAVGEMNESKTF